MQILLIDDDPTQLRLREAVLRDAGLCLLTAGTADEALALLRKPEIVSSLGLIVTDHMMPGTCGATFVRELRRFSRVPVIVVSGMAEAESEYADLKVRFLAKPCLPQELILEARRALLL